MPITAAVVTDPTRVSVSLTAWPVDGALTVTRVHPDGSRWPVRGADGLSSVVVSGGVGAVLDDEAPYMAQVIYEAVSLVSNPVTVDIDTAFVTVPGLPGLRMPLTLVAKPGASRERPATVITPRGRRNRVVISDALKGRLFQVRVRTKTFAEADLLEDLAESGATLLLRMPGTRWPWVYATVTKLEAEPVVHYRPAADASPTDVSAWEEWVLSCEESDPPVGGITGDPTGSWDAITAAGLTWDQLTAAGVTWAALGLGAY